MYPARRTKQNSLKTFLVARLGWNKAYDEKSTLSTERKHALVHLIASSKTCDYQ